MGIPVEKPRHSVEQYFQLEFDASDKHEYHDGEILAMAGTSYDHCVILPNVVGELRAALKGKPCRVLDGNLRIRIPGTPRYVYPDASVICGQPQFDPLDPRPMTVTNSRVIIEVLSPSTEAYDRGDKFTHYREIASLEEYIRVSQDRPSVETFSRQPDGSWSFTTFSGRDAVLKVRCLGVELPMAEVYVGVEWEGLRGAK